MKTLDQVQAFFQTELAGELKVLEQRRRAVVRNGLIAGGVMAVIGLVIGIVVMAQGAPPFILLFLLIGGLVVGALVMKVVSGGFVGDFKQRVIGRLIPFLEPGLSYHPADSIDQYTFQGCRLYEHRIDRYRGEDLVRGRVDKTELVFSEIHAEYKTTTTDSKGRTRTTWHTIFKGLFFIGDFHKHFAGQTLVLPDTAEKMFGRFGQMLQSWNKLRGDLVKLEDPEFEREFVVYSDDQIEARYILSTSLMERIVNFKRKTGTQIALSFTGSKVYVAVPMSRDLFEPKLFSSMLDFEPIREYYADLETAVGIVEDLNLNTRIWSKE